ncbi:MAG TPA: LamB/YcsF family protein [Firmicutes bacterium]|nr:LamB/YcsF family protein [Bacillota bacterium]HCF91842.1 LamB/YcsF family protein [Bacillota bacterium]
MPRIDLNCDLGESFGVYHLGADREIMTYVTSANIACGFHAGDPSVMRRTVEMAAECGAAIGAHPGLPDLPGFGRRELRVTAREAEDLIVYQIGALDAFARASGAKLSHVKPHGALYNMIARDVNLARAAAAAVRAVDPGLLLYLPVGSAAVQVAMELGLTVIEEGFADRTYLPDGNLTPRSKEGALVSDPAEAGRRAVLMAMEGKALCADGAVIALRPGTICIHGDQANAADFARAVAGALNAAGITIQSPAPALASKSASTSKSTSTQASAAKS